MKKTFILIIIMLFMMPFIQTSFVKKIFAAGEEYEFVVKVFSEEENFDFSSIKYSLYKSNLESISNSQNVEQYNHTYLRSETFDIYGKSIFKGTYDNYMLEIDLASLPAGYGVISKIQHVSKNNTYVEFNIFEVDRIDFSCADSTNYSIKLLSKYDDILFADYCVNLEEYDSYFEALVNINGKNYNCYTEKTSSVRLLSNNSTYSVFNTMESMKETYNNTYDSGSFRFRYSDGYSETTLLKLEYFCERIKEYLNNAEIYFNNMNYYSGECVTEIDNNKEYKVIFLYVSERESLAETYYMQGEVRTVHEKVDSVFIAKKYFNFLVNTKVLNDIQTNIKLQNFIESVCVHEYFHLIMYGYGISEDECIQEAFATFMEIFYVNERNYINNEYIQSGLYKRVWQSSFISSCSTLTKKDECDKWFENYDYGLSIFNLFLYEKFDNINFVKSIIENYSLYKDYEAYERIAEINNTTLSDLYEEFGIFRIFPNKYILNINQFFIQNWSVDNRFNKFCSSSNASNNASNNICSNYLSNELNPSKIEKYSWHCIRIEKNNLTFDKAIDITINLNTPLSDEFMIYILEENYELSPSVTKINSESNLITINAEILNLEDNNELFIIIMNCGNRDIENPYEWTYSISAKELGQKIVISSNTASNFSVNGTTLLKPLEILNPGFYSIELVLDNSNITNLRDNTLEIYDKNFNLISKFNHESAAYASTLKGENSIIVKLNKTYSGGQSDLYYIRIGYYCSILEGTIEIKRINSQNSILSEDNFEKVENIDFVNFSGDKYIYYNLKAQGTLNLDIVCHNILENESQEIVIVLRYLHFSIVENYEFATITYNENQAKIQVDTSIYNEVFIFVLNGNNIKDVSISIDLDIKGDFSIILDPSNVQSELIGSEVRINGGEYGGTSITVGLTRNAFLGESAPSNSRLDYTWSSSNEDVATISAYGTILALSPGKTIIQAKFSQNKMGYIVVDVKSDSCTTQKTFTITTDLRQDGLVGTYVGNGYGDKGEVNLIVGYTRLMSLTSDAPSTIIQNYTWTSDNPSVATVSMFGTVTALNRGTVEITATYKYNPRFSGSITLYIE